MLDRDSFDGVSIFVLDASGVPVTLTGTLTETNLAVIDLPPLGPNSLVRMELLWSATNNANTKETKARVGGVQVFGFNLTTDTFRRQSILLANRGDAAQVLSSNWAWYGSTVGTPAAVHAVDTRLGATLEIRGRLLNVGDVLTLEAYLIEIFNKPNK